MGRILPWLTAAIVATTLSPLAAAPKYAIAMQGEPALAADYSHFDYANPDAPKGGAIT
jgi:peptide/nickel transport system substrate-binding protein